MGTFYSNSKQIIKEILLKILLFVETNVFKSRQFCKLFFTLSVRIEMLVVMMVRRVWSRPPVRRGQCNCSECWGNDDPGGNEGAGSGQRGRGPG